MAIDITQDNKYTVLLPHDALSAERDIVTLMLSRRLSYTQGSR